MDWQDWTALGLLGALLVWGVVYETRKYCDERRRAARRGGRA